MIEPNKKYKIKREIPGVAYKGMIIAPEPGTDKGLVRGGKGGILCRIEPAGSLFFNEADLEAI